MSGEPTVHINDKGQKASRMELGWPRGCWQFWWPRGFWLRHHRRDRDGTMALGSALAVTLAAVVVEVGVEEEALQWS